jgi:hypothetical protein
MRWVKFSVAVLFTSAALVVALFATGAVMVGHALASGLPAAAQMRGMDHANVPPELAGLKDIPADQRFAHFKGIQASLTDQDGKPVTIAVTPGVATSVSAGSITLAGNDGASHTYTLNDQTMTHGQTITTGENVVVVTLNNAGTARAVFGLDPSQWRHQ